MKNLLSGLSLSIVLMLSSSTVLGLEGASPEWREKMNSLSKTLAEIVPFLFPNPELDSKGLTKKVKALRDITKDLDSNLSHSSKAPDKDPILPYLTGALSSDIERAYKSLEQGHSEYAKSVLRSSVSYCIACHTRSKSGVEFPLLAAFSVPLKKATWIEKIEVLAASRQFDQVLEEVKEKLGSKGPQSISGLDLEKASRIALSLAIRVKQSPEQSLSLANSILKSKGATAFMKESASEWIVEIKKWQSEKASKNLSDREILDLAKSWLDEKSSAHSEVLQLRASVMLHELIKTAKEDALLAEAFYWIGRSYESLQDLGLWSLHEVYYLACIDKTPHSKLAETCYKEYENSIVLGYSGSSGVHVPSDISEQLKILKKKSSQKVREKRSQ